MILKGRLKLIADKVPKCGVFADIGTDHAYLPIYLIKNNICTHAIASDVKPGPIRVANRNIMSHRLDSKVETRMGSGLDTLKLGEADTIVIAGMGGTLLAQLLDEGKDKAQRAKNLVLQPMNDLDIVRQWLYNNGFNIYDEQMIDEGEKIYTVICAVFENANHEVREEFYYHVGEKLIEKKDPLLNKYCKMKIRQLERVLKQLESMENNASQVEYHSWLKLEYEKLLVSLA